MTTTADAVFESGLGFLTTALPFILVFGILGAITYKAKKM